MAQKPPSAKVTKFKEFAKEHPGLVEEVRNHKRSWQDIYEEWDIYGEDANLWKQFRAADSVKQAAGSRNAGGGGSRPSPKQGSSSQNKGGLNLGSLFSLIEKIDFDQFQKGLSQASGALDTVQKLMGQSQNQNQNPSQGGMNPYGNGQQGQYGNGAPGPYGNRPPNPYWNGAPGAYGNGAPGPYGYNNMQGPPQSYGPPRPNGYGAYQPQNPPQNNNGNNMNNGQDGNNGNNGG